MKIWQPILVALAAGTVYVTCIQAMTLYHKLSDLHSSMLAPQTALSSPEGLDRIQVPDNLVTLAKQSLLSAKWSSGAGGEDGTVEDSGILRKADLNFNRDLWSSHQIVAANKGGLPRAEDPAIPSLHMRSGLDEDGAGPNGFPRIAQSSLSATDVTPGTGAIMLSDGVSTSSSGVSVGEQEQSPLQQNEDKSAQIEEMPLSKSQLRITRAKKANKKRNRKESQKPMLAKGQEEATAHSTSEEPSNAISDMLLRGNKGVAAGDGGTEERFGSPMSRSAESTNAMKSSGGLGGAIELLSRTPLIKEIASPKPYKHQYQCFGRAVGVISEKARFTKQSCAFHLNPSEVLLGVSVSEGTMDRVQPIARTWKDRVSTVFLGATQHKKYDILVTGVNRDDYRSTLGKGFLGLHEMFRKYPDMKWYGLFDDDCFVNADGLVSALSAFDPKEKW
jgi:hypothetical protein